MQASNQKVIGLTHVGRSIILRQSGGLSQFGVSICGYIHIYLAVHSPEIIGGFNLEGKSPKLKAVCGLTYSTNYGSLWNVRPSILDLHDGMPVSLTEKIIFHFIELVVNTKY